MLDCEYDLNNSDWQNINGDITQRKIRTIKQICSFVGSNFTLTVMV